MSITAIDTVAMSASEPAASKPDVLGKNDFLNLLVTQLRNQDPLNPMESADFTAQLAQFSSLEQLYNVNDNLQFLQLYQASLNNSQAVGFIGKTITASGNSIDLSDGISDKMHFDLEAEASAVYVNIYDSAGNLVKDITADALSAGKQTLEWDGSDNEGNEVADGIYTFEVMAVDAYDEMVNVTTFIEGEITGVTFIDGVAYLLSGNKEIPIGTVIEVSGT